MDLEVGGGGQEVWTTPGNLLNSQSQIPKFIGVTEESFNKISMAWIFEFLQFTKCLLQIKKKINISQTICHGK